MRSFSEKATRLLEAGLESTARLSALQKWLLALGMFVTALGLRLIIAEFMGGGPLSIFRLGVIGAALFTGTRQAIVVTLLSAAAGVYFFLPPTGSFALARPDAMFTLAAFVFECAVLILLARIVKRLLLARTAALRTQELLLRELHHRVGNKMQMLAGFLTQGKSELRRGVPAEDVLDKAIARFNLFADLHNQMRHADEPGSLRAFLPQMLGDVFFQLPVTVDVVVKTDQVSLAQFTPLVLLIHEAATNARKHVFEEGKGSRFRVTLDEAGDNRIRLLIEDDGPGFRPERARPNSLGLRIMRSIGAQLGGELDIASDGGTVIGLDFPMEGSRRSQPPISPVVREAA